MKKIKKNKNKKIFNKNRLFYFIIFGLIAIIIIATSIKFVCDYILVEEEKEVVTKNTLDSLDTFGYTLDDLDTELYKSYFNELKEVLNKEEIDYNSYASVLIKLFVTDFYTLSNKLTSSDIGGEEFVYPNFVENFKLHAGDTMYNHVKNNIYGDRNQVLPTVSNVNIDEVVTETYKYNGQDYEAYKVTASWEYEEDLGYEKSGVFYLILDNSKLFVVQKLGE